MLTQRFSMPRKTKKQKLRADLRRKQFLNTIEEVKPLQSTEKSTHTHSPIFYKISDSNIENQRNLAPETTVNFFNHYLISDLKKTLILTTLAILFELVLYLRLR